MVIIFIILIFWATLNSASVITNRTIESKFTAFAISFLTYMFIITLIICKVFLGGMA